MAEKNKRDLELARKSDEEVVADVRMLVQELSRHSLELKRRKIEIDYLHYSDGSAKVEIYRSTREDL